MRTFNFVNYSLRPNKAIQRSLVFEGVRSLQDGIDLRDMIFVGMGSVWFSDFLLAHKFLRIGKMVSIEGDEIGFRRAKFNQPFKTVDVELGLSHDVVPKLLVNESLNKRPWFIWLDYDEALDEKKVEDIRRVVESSPPNSILVSTFPAVGAYGKLSQRPDRLKSLFGSVVPDDLPKSACEEDAFQETLLHLTADYMKSVAASSARPGGFIKAFRISYRDSSPMVTVGGILPAKGAMAAVSQIVSSDGWGAMPSLPIITPPLTFKEVSVLQAQLPSTRRLTRRQIQRLGFDLTEDQMRSFEKFYRYYPTFAQVAM